MDLTSNIIGILTQTGLAGVAIAALVLVYKIVVTHTATTADVIKGNSEALAANTEVTRSLKETIERKL